MSKTTMIDDYNSSNHKDNSNDDYDNINDKDNNVNYRAYER